MIPKFATFILTGDEKVRGNIMNYLDSEIPRKEQYNGRTEYPLGAARIRIEGDLIGLTSEVPEDIREGIRALLYGYAIIEGMSRKQYRQMSADLGGMSTRVMKKRGKLVLTLEQGEAILDGKLKTVELYQVDRKLVKSLICIKTGVNQ